LGDTISIDNVSVKEISVATEIEQAIYDLLRFNTTVAALVVERISPALTPQDGTLPAITYQEISGIRHHTLEGKDDMVESRFQINCYDDDYGGTRTLAEAVRGALDSYHGTVGSVVIQCIHLEDEGDLFDMEPEERASRRYGKRLDFRVWFNS